jgi:hypothetical protein
VGTGPWRRNSAIDRIAPIPDVPGRAKRHGSIVAELRQLERWLSLRKKTAACRKIGHLFQVGNVRADRNVITLTQLPAATLRDASRPAG